MNTTLEFKTTCSHTHTTHTQTVFNQQTEMLPVNADTNLSSISKFQECNSEIPTCQAQRQLFIILTPILLALSTIGNCLALAVMLRRSLRKTATAVLIASLATSDLIATWTGLTRHFILKLTGDDVRQHSPLSCQFQRFILYLSLDTSAWILAVITIERFIAVCFATKHIYFNSAQKAGYAVIGIIIAQVTFNAHVFWTRGEQLITENDQIYTIPCGYPKPAYENYWDNHQGWLSMVVYSILPATIMTVLNILIIRKLWQLRHKVKSYTVNKQTRHQRTRRTSSLTKMLLTVTCYFILVTTPVFLFTILEGGILYKQTEAPSDEQKARWELIDGILTCLLYVNHSMNFFLYCVSGRKFRRELAVMFYKAFPCCMKSCRRSLNQSNTEMSQRTKSHKVRKDESTNTDSSAVHC